MVPAPACFVTRPIQRSIYCTNNDPNGAACDDSFFSFPCFTKQSSASSRFAVRSTSTQLPFLSRCLVNNSARNNMRNRGVLHQNTLVSALQIATFLERRLLLKCYSQSLHDRKNIDPLVAIKLPSLFDDLDQVLLARTSMSKRF
jgi:hypothetical protein